MAWVGDGEPWSAVWHLLPNGVGSWSSGLNNDERRMFLLFVAEAVK